MLIGRIGRLMRQAYDLRAHGAGMTRAQWHTMTVIRFNEGASQRLIANILDVGEVTAGRLIAQLEDEGWVERRPDASDGRISRVHLASGAAAALATLEHIEGEEEASALAGLTSAEIAELGRCLNAIASNLAEAQQSARRACGRDAPPSAGSSL
jgi:DNA-binding MarR family transcriptional regulator